MRRMRRSFFWPVAAGCLVSLACRVWLGAPEACTTELGMNPRPVNPVVHPGQSFVATIELTTCQGAKRWRPNVVWRAGDTLVVHVDSLRGVVTARAPGATEVMPFERDPRGDFRYAGVYVTVTP